MQETEMRVLSLCREDPLEKEKTTPFQYSCLKNPMERSLVGYSAWGLKESGTTELLTEHTACDIHTVKCTEDV